MKILTKFLQCLQWCFDNIMLVIGVIYIIETRWFYLPTKGLEFLSRSDQYLIGVIMVCSGLVVMAVHKSKG